MATALVSLLLIKDHKEPLKRMCKAGVLKAHPKSLLSFEEMLLKCESGDGLLSWAHVFKG